MRPLVLFLGIMLAAGCGTPASIGGRQAGGTVRIATYNVGVFGKSGGDSMGMVAEMVREMGAAVLSVNELDSCNRRHREFQLREFAEAMGGWGYNYAPSIDFAEGTYGIGIAFRPELKPVRSFRLKLSRADGSEQRALAVCEFKDFVLCSTHLDHVSKDAQLIQAKEISSWIEKTYARSRKPVFLCGDFNATPDSGTIAFLKEDWTILSPSGNTYPAINPRKCIDYIMLFKNAAGRVRLIDARIQDSFSNGDVTIASDHLPVYVDVKF